MFFDTFLRFGLMCPASRPEIKLIDDDTWSKYNEPNAVAVADVCHRRRHRSLPSHHSTTLKYVSANRRKIVNYQLAGNGKFVIEKCVDLWRVEKKDIDLYVWRARAPRSQFQMDTNVADRKKNGWQTTSIKLCSNYWLCQRNITRRQPTDRQNKRRSEHTKNGGNINDLSPTFCSFHFPCIGSIFRRSHPQQ